MNKRPPLLTQKSLCYDKTGPPTNSDQGSSSLPSSPTIKRAYRLVILGSKQTGKSCIVKRFLHRKFDDIYTPTIEDFHRKLYRIKGEYYQLDILDTSGNDPFPAARRLLLLTGDLFLLVYSLDNFGSYEEVFRIKDQILELKTENKQPSKVPIVIAGNKTDLPPDKLEILNSNLESTIFPVIPCSAKTGDGVDEIFSKIMEGGKLPKEMHPGYHENLRETTSLGKLVSKSPLLRLRSRPSDPSGTVDDARRPSLRTELFLSKTKSSSALLRKTPFTTCTETQTQHSDIIEEETGSRISGDIVPKSVVQIRSPEKEETPLNKESAPPNHRYLRKQSIKDCVIS